MSIKTRIGAIAFKALVNKTPNKLTTSAISLELIPTSMPKIIPAQI